MNLLPLGFIIIMSTLVMILPRRYAVIPIIVTACYMTYGQVVMVGGLHFYFIRITLFFGWIRLIVRQEISPFKFLRNDTDKLFVAWVFSSVIINFILYQTSEALIYRLGFAYNALGSYFLFRILLKDIEDIDRIIRVMAIMIIPLSAAMLFEHFMGRNLFSVFGGVPELTVIRAGRLRCQGPFLHPILAGTFGAALLPLFIGTWIKDNNHRLIAAFGIISATVITVMSASGGPVMTYIYGIVGLLMWFYRRQMRAIRWGILIMIIALHMVMKAPVWYLIGRLSSIVGGTGWHRSELINQAIKHFGEWWLIGTKYTAHWMPNFLPNEPAMSDITNQFIHEGINGGLLTMVLFIAIIVVCFSVIGRSVKMFENKSFSMQILIWSLGASLFAHVASFLGVSYFDQLVIFWYMLLAMISAVSIQFNAAQINKSNDIALSK